MREEWVCSGRSSGFCLPEDGDEAGEGFEREHFFHGCTEDAGDFQAEFEAGRVIVAFEAADGLGVNADAGGEVFPGQAEFGAEDGDAVEHEGMVAWVLCIDNVLFWWRGGYGSVCGSGRGV
ncbi:hypothetical protein AOE01nite_05090 [Acetobacter oeni]|uniref:Uncharacterized protein n=1 Tax=Acetobacter oeni TaxID=304077 RepID=A0A511XH61_9PROT|nr:hypothetical protein AOE01nite_05090 [Acetobacter oeni]